jgi:hypothetical protein
MAECTKPPEETGHRPGALKRPTHQMRKPQSAQAKSWLGMAPSAQIAAAAANAIVHLSRRRRTVGSSYGCLNGSTSGRNRYPLWLSPSRIALWQAAQVAPDNSFAAACAAI